MTVDLLKEGRAAEDRLRRVEPGFATEVLVGMCRDAANLLAAFRLEVVLLRARGKT